jgi:phage terminase small subunit
VTDTKQQSGFDAKNDEKPPPKLTPKQLIFKAEYLVSFNAAKAAIAAGYSAKAAKEQGARLLTNAHISSAIEEELNKRLERLEISADKVLQQIARLAFYDIRKLYNADGTLKPITELDDLTQVAICGIEVERLYEHFGKGQAKSTGTLTKIKLADRGINLERLGRHLKLFTDKIELSGSVSIADRIAKARQRVAKRDEAVKP